MKSYEYRGFDASGRSCRGLVEARSVKNAREKLSGRSILAEKILEAGRPRRVRAAVRAVLYRELAALLSAGFPLERALEILIESPEMSETRGMLAVVRDGVREGRSLAAALAEGGASVTVFERAIIDAAEQSASVPAMLERLAGFLEHREKLRERIHSALLYPALVVCVAVCVAVVMLGLLLPRAREILAGSQAPMPRLTAGMITLGAGLGKWGVPALAVVVAAGWLFARRLRRDADLRERWDRVLYGLPVWGRGYALLVNLRFAHTLAILLRGGVALLDAVRLSGRATGSPWLARLAADESEAIRHGSNLADAVGRIPPLAASLPGWIRVGEAGGGLERLLENAGERYEERWDRYLSRSLTLLEPTLILVIGMFVLLVTLAVLLPVLSLSRTLAG